jgi:hypothetical protein
MKFSAYFISLIVLFILASCTKQSTQAGENYISVNQCQSYYNGSVTCCLDSVIQDSRCPLNATCIWAGIGVVRFKVNVSTAAHTITLATFKFPPYPPDTIVSGFKIELVNLSAQKEMEKPFGYNDYIAEVKVTKL